MTITVNMGNLPNTRHVELETAVSEILDDVVEPFLTNDGRVGELTEGEIRANSNGEMIARMIEVLVRNHELCDELDVSYILTGRHVNICSIERD